MKLLFDENLSRRMASRLQELFPGSIHVSEVELAGAPDEAIWKYAREGGLVIVTADSDFLDLEAAYGPPPKVVWLKSWRHAVRDCEALLRREAIRMVEFERDSELGVLVLRWVG